MKLRLPSFKTKKAFEMAIADNRKYLAHITGSALLIVEVFTGKEIAQFKDLKNPSHIAFCQNSDLIAIKNVQGLIAIYNLKDLILERVINPNHGEGCNLFFSPDGQYIIDADWKGYISLIDIKNGMIKTLKYFQDCMIEGIDYNLHTNKFLFLVGPKASNQTGVIESDNTLLEWEYPFTNAPTSKKVPAATLCIARYSLDGQFIAYSNNWLHKVRVYNSHIDDIICEIETNIVSHVAWGKEKIGIVDQDTIAIYSYPDLKLLKEIKMDYACFIDFAGDFTLIGSWTNGFYLNVDDLMEFSVK